MKKEIENQSEEIRTDLKHDNMEFSAPTEGDDKLDIDSADFEEEEISAEELEELADDEADEAAAYASVENDILVDAEILPEEDWTDDLPDDVASLDEADDEEDDI